MSGYGAIRRKMTELLEEKPDNPFKCAADGCPGRATISVQGSRFCCAAHAFAEPKEWPAVTHSMIENRWLIDFIDEIKLMETNLKDWRGLAVKFWAGQDESCAPDPKEDFTPYENRMRGELLFRCGQANRPTVRRPKPQTGRRGGYNFDGLKP